VVLIQREVGAQESRTNVAETFQSRRRVEKAVS
jgi:hypothetical protein